MATADNRSEGETMKIRVNDPEVAKELLAALAALDCAAEQTSHDTVAVDMPWINDATDERQAEMELSFFVKAWGAGRPGLAAVVTA